MIGDGRLKGQHFLARREVAGEAIIHLERIDKAY